MPVGISQDQSHQAADTIDSEILKTLSRSPSFEHSETTDEMEADRHKEFKSSRGGGRGGSSKIKGGRRGSKHREPTEEGYPEDNKTYGSQGLSRWESFGLSQILAQVESISNI